MEPAVEESLKENTENVIAHNSNNVSFLSPLLSRIDL